MGKQKRQRMILLLALFLVTAIWTSVGIRLVVSLTDKNRATEDVDEVQNLATTSEGEEFVEADLAKLREKNSDTVGWIQITGTSINYPFVQGRDNNYYRNHSFNKVRNTTGWPFLDARNARDLSSPHNIIYLHGKIEGTDFEEARGVIANANWIDEPEKFMMRTSTENGDTLWRIFSFYKIKNTDDYLTVDFKNPGEMMRMIQMVKERSVYQFEVPVSESDKLLTFSIQYNDEYVVVLHAKMVENPEIENTEQDIDQDLLSE